MNRIARCASLLALAGCAAGDSAPFAQTEPALAGTEATAAAPATSPQPLPAPSGRSAEALDTTTEAERSAALAPAAAGGERALGRTVASLGPPGEQGIWVKTPLVSQVTQGRAVWTQTGQSIAVELRPAGDDSGASQISLAALRLLGAPLTGLPELALYAR